MKKVVILGSSGSGKSTLAKLIGEKTGLPVFHFDRLFWSDNWVNVSGEVFLRRVEEVLAQQEWITDGNYNKTLDRRIADADTIIFLDMSLAVCLCSVLRRLIKYHGTVRPDIAPNCSEKIDCDLIRYIFRFHKETRCQYLTLLNSLPPNKQIYIIKSRRQLAAFVDSL